MFQALREKVKKTYKQIRNYYLIPANKRAIIYNHIQAKKSRQKAAQEGFARNVSEQTGWTQKDAFLRMKKAKERCGVTFQEYWEHRFFEIPEEEQTKQCLKIREMAEQEARRDRRERRDGYLKKIAAVTGWSMEQTRDAVKDAKNRTGCSAKEYFEYKFYLLDKAEQEQMFVINFSKQITKKYDVNPMFVNMLRNKAVTNKFFAEYVKRPWCVNTEVTLEEFKDIFKNSSRIFYKPLGLNGGRGAAPYHISEENIEEVYNEVITFDPGVVEEYVRQHEKMNQLAPSAVNTVRFVTISSLSSPVTKEGSYVDIAYVSLKMGGVESVVDNLHGGGMVAAVDVATGMLITNAADGNGNAYEKHPATGTVIKGFRIPLYEEARAMVLEAIAKNKLEGYLGWDIAITETGPVLIELNTTPGAILLTMPYVEEKKGMKPVMEKYL